MENQTMLSKTIGLHKTAYANTLAIFSTMQQQGEDLLKTTLEQSPWLPKSSKYACLYCVDFYSKYLENLKSLADQGFAEIERISSLGSKQEEKESQQTINKERILAPRPVIKSPTVREKKARAKKTVVAETLPDQKPVTQNLPTEKPVAQNVPVEKPVTQNLFSEKPVTQKAPVEKPVTQKAPVEKPVAQNVTTEKLSTQNVPVEKPVTLPNEKLVAHEKPEVKINKEVKATASIPEPPATSQPTANPVLGNKESASKLLRQKG